MTGRSRSSTSTSTSSTSARRRSRARSARAGLAVAAARRRERRTSAVSRSRAPKRLVLQTLFARRPRDRPRQPALRRRTRPRLMPPRAPGWLTVARRRRRRARLPAAVLRPLGRASWTRATCSPSPTSWRTGGELYRDATGLPAAGRVLPPRGRVPRLRHVDPGRARARRRRVRGLRRARPSRCCGGSCRPRSPSPASRSCSSTASGPSRTGRCTATPRPRSASSPGRSARSCALADGRPAWLVAAGVAAGSAWSASRTTAPRCSSR